MSDTGKRRFNACSNTAALLYSSTYHSSTGMCQGCLFATDKAKGKGQISKRRTDKQASLSCVLQTFVFGILF
jgi:hypothetical protein